MYETEIDRCEKELLEALAPVFGDDRWFVLNRISDLIKAHLDAEREDMKTHVRGELRDLHDEIKQEGQWDPHY